MPYSLRLAGVCCLIVLLAACSRPLPTIGSLAEASREDFMHALRWKRYQIAASHMQPDHRPDFLVTFQALKDIHITDVRLIDLQGSDAEQRFDAVVEFDYYLLPSVTLKTFSFAQTWVYVDGDEASGSGFQIVTPFPGFP